MLHTIEVLKYSISHTDNRHGARNREFRIKVDGIIMEAKLLFVACQPSHGRAPYAYRLHLNNNLIAKDKDYKSIRLAILHKLGEMEYALNLRVVDRMPREY